MKGNTLYIDRLQFYWRLKSSPNEKNIVPDFLPFELIFNDKLSLFTQKRNKKLMSVLNKIYKEEYNIGNFQEVNDWGHLYSRDFLSFMDSSISSHGKKKIKKILEIGAGACLLLKIFKNKGYDVLGIDPSVLVKKEGEKRGVKVVVDFYPSKKIKGKFDLIFHSDVLEHISNPVRFLRHNFEQLHEGGLVILTVPDCTDSITYGDISMLYHQHINYFDKESLENAFQEAGFSDIYIERAKFGGSLNCVGKKYSKKKRHRIIMKTKSKYKNFLKKNYMIVTKMKTYVDAMLTDRAKTLGFYAPIRTLPYLALLNLYKGFRFFDDTSRWHLQYLDGIDIHVENFDDLKRKPVTDLAIMTPTFGDVIENKVLDYFGNRIKVKKLIDFF